MKPSDTTALITGASSGIGYATAIHLAKQGFDVIATSRVYSRLQQLKEETDRLGFSITCVELEINSDNAVEEVMSRLIDDHDGIDVLVNNAGYGLFGPVQTISANELRAQYETNVIAPMKLANTVLPRMIKQRKGTIINVSSVLGQLGTPYNGAYVSSKFALEGMSESLRIEVWPFGVNVVLVQPGLYATQFQQNQVHAEQLHNPGLPLQRYLDAYFQRRGHSRRFAKDPIAVAKVIHRIIRSKRPNFRYPVSLEARTGLLAKRFLPERLFQYLVSRLTFPREQE